MFSTEKLTFTFQENGITAIDGVTFQFAAGKIHAVLGENGAGKSTLARLCTGHLQPDGGRLRYKGLPLSLHSPSEGITKGLVLVPQHPQLSSELTVWENLAIGLHTVKDMQFGFLSPQKASAAIAAALEQYGISLPLSQKAGTLDAAQLHWTAIAEALLKCPSVLFLDEPSAAFSPLEIEQLYRILRSYADKGACILVITHRIQEVLKFMDIVHILRNGKAIRSCPIDSGIDAEILLQDIFSSERADTPIAAMQIPEQHISNTAGDGELQKTNIHESKNTGLELSNITAISGKGIRFSDFSLHAPCNAITGIVGIKKQGLELLEYLLINAIKPDRGIIRFNGQPLTRISRETYAYIPSKRMRNGIADRHSIAKNLYARARAFLYRYGIFSEKAVESWQRKCLFDIPRSWEDPVLSLSGGMIQKLIFSRELDNPEPQLVICAEPYWGLDRKVQLVLLQKLRQLAAHGAAVIVLTSDADAALETCDCIHVLYHGVLTHFMTRPSYNRLALIAAMVQANKNE